MRTAMSRLTRMLLLGAALTGVGREGELRAMSESFQTAFGVVVGLAALGALLAVLFRPRGSDVRGSGRVTARKQRFEQAHDDDDDAAGKDAWSAVRDSIGGSTSRASSKRTEGYDDRTVS
jgi:hypothetical protein